MTRGYPRSLSRNAAPDLASYRLVRLDPSGQVIILRRLPIDIADDRWVAQDQIRHQVSKHHTAVVVQVCRIVSVKVIHLRGLFANSIHILPRRLVQVDVPRIRAVGSCDGGDTLFSKAVGCDMLGAEFAPGDWGDEDLDMIVSDCMWKIVLLASC